MCIYLSEVTVYDMIKHYNRILSVTAVYRSKVKVVFLECPQYSVKIGISIHIVEILRVLRKI